MITRKKLIIIIAILVIFCAVSSVFLFSEKEIDQKYVEETLSDELFCAPDYDYDILTDEEYLSLNRVISYKNGAVTYTVAPEQYEATDKVLAFFGEFTETIINGNAEKYEKFFSSKYREKYDLPKAFTMQRLHNLKVEKISESDITEDGVIRNQYVYSLEYMIDKNDGTFRRDIDSNSTKPQFFVITEREGVLQIDKIITYIENKE